MVNVYDRTGASGTCIMFVRLRGAVLALERFNFFRATAGITLERLVTNQKKFVVRTPEPSRNPGPNATLGNRVMRH